MKQRAILSAFISLLCAGWTYGQNSTAKATPTPPSDDRVVVTTNLVQVDAVVTDKNGKQITDLRPDDFELVEGGRTREIVGFSYVPLTSTATGTNTSAAKTPERPQSQAVPPNLHALRPESVRRAVAILVDDFGLSFEGMARLRTALEKFVSDQTEPTDVIAVVRSSAGPGAMQQFTANRAEVLATIKRLRWYPTGRGGMSSAESINPHEHDWNGLDLQGYSSPAPPDLSNKEFMGGSLGALAFVVDRLSKFPGRKSIVLISENLPLTTLGAQVSGATNALDRVIQFANQHSIVISTMDARGLPKPGMTTDDSQYDLAANQVDKRMRERAIQFNVRQDTLSYIAQNTGGIFVRNNNDLDNGLRRIIDSVQGYYLMAFRPDDADKERSRRTYKVTVRLKRPDLELRSRSTFTRFAETTNAVAPPTKDDELRDALASPFVKEDVRLKLTVLFTGSSQIKVLLHVDARDLALAEATDETYKASFDLAIVAFDNNGKVAQELRRTEPVSVPAEHYEQVLRDGLVYTISMPIQKAGPYQVRVAVRDDDTGAIGSDSQSVDIPEVRTSRLSVAGLIMQGMTVETRSRPAVRQFAPGDTLEYSLLVYGARQNGDRASLTSQIRLVRGAEELFTRNAPSPSAKEPGNEAIIVGGTFSLPQSLPPGEYFLQVIVTDELAPADRQTSSQWIDFEIVK
jgi:VWFA-related protein